MQKQLPKESFVVRRAAADGLAEFMEGKPSIRRDPIRWLVGCGVLLIAAIAIGTAVMVSNFRERALENSERELENAVLLLARHFDQQLDDFEVVQNGLITQARSAEFTSPEVYRREMSTYETHLMMKAKVSGSSDAASVNVYDTAGTLINSSEAWPTPAINIADRAYFKALRSDIASLPHQVELVRSRFTGGMAVIIARKIVGRDGEFLGVTTRGFVPTKFEDFFSSVALGKDAAISMYDPEGAMLARYPHVEELVGQRLHTAPLYQTILSKTDHNTSRIISPIDSQARLISVRRLSHFPITVAATTTVISALADWRAQTRFLIASAILSAIVVAAILFLIVRRLSQQHRSSQRRLGLEKQRLDTAVNNMTHGLLLFDSSARLVIWNQRYIEMYGVSPDVVKRGASFRDITAHRKETGSFVGDIDEYCSTIQRELALRKVNITQTADGRYIEIMNNPVADGGWVSIHEDVTERRRSDQRIAHMAHYDALTNLPNRAHFRELLERELVEIRPDKQLAVLYLDIDNFKDVNDSLGHQIGDEFLKAIAAGLARWAGEIGFVARLGGDEFAILQSAVDGPEDVTNLIMKVYEAIRQPHECLGHQLVADASIGVALAPQHGTELDQILTNADLAMYSAKAAGRRTHCLFEPAMNARVKARRALEVDLRQAIIDGSFELHYQPLVSLSDNNITGFEALLRWRHPERGMVSPADFIPIAEETGLINQLGEWVLTTACAEAMKWPDYIRIAVNVSPIQFRSPILGLKVAAALSASGLAANRLELEITEAVLISDDETALGILHQLRALGVRIALDDFGTGYSSLSYLQRFPFDKIKIDRCFVSTVAEIGGSSAIVQAVVNIAAASGMTTTAEGVETEQQRELLRSLGCTEMQGYLFSRPRPVAEIMALLSPEARHEGHLSALL
jgi:diguanylate cyclase (GGDEF)-like protein/PAS domain S-box-containing protein